MCIEFYVGTNEKSGDFEVAYDDENPTFHVREIHDENHGFFKQLLGIERLFKFGSHMGCGCGLNTTYFSVNTPGEDYEARVQDVENMRKYLQKHNSVFREILSPDISGDIWTQSRDSCVKATMILSKVNPDDFDLEEDVIFTVVP